MQGKFGRWLIKTILIGIANLVLWCMIALFFAPTWAWANPATFIIAGFAAFVMAGIIADPLTSEERSQRNTALWLQNHRGFTPEEVLHYAMLLRLAEAKLLPHFYAEHMENEAEHLMNLRAYFENLERYL